MICLSEKSEPFKQNLSIFFQQINFLKFEVFKDQYYKARISVIWVWTYSTKSSAGIFYQPDTHSEDFSIVSQF